jgi:signal transduction histidine kinase
MCYFGGALKKLSLKGVVGTTLLGTSAIASLALLCVERVPYKLDKAGIPPWVQVLILIHLYSGMFLLGRRTLRALARTGGELNTADARIRELELALEQAQSELVDSGIERGRTETARRTAEELRPPVAALSLILQRLPDLNADSIEAAQGALTKIRAVTADMLRAAGDPDLAGPSPEDAPVAEPLLAILERVLQTKKHELRGRPRVHIDGGALPGYPGPFAKVDPVALSGVLSDLIDNAVEALIAGEGKVRMDLIEFPQKGFVELRVSDDGAGVPQEVVASLGIKRVSPSRKPGHGLFNAFHRIKEWGGQLTLARRPDRGTVCSIRMPLTGAPSWLATPVRLPAGARVLVLEKEPEMMNRWGNYSALVSPGLTFRLATRGVDFDAFCRESREGRPDVCFVSQELGDELINGLDLIDANRVAARSVLVTTAFENRALRRRAERLGVKILPKELIDAAVGPEIRHLLRGSSDPGLKLGLMPGPFYHPVTNPNGARG